MASCPCSSGIRSVVPNPITATTALSTAYSEGRLSVSNSTKSYAVLSRIDCPHVVFLRPYLNGWTDGSIILLTTRNKDGNNCVDEDIKCKVEFISAHRSQAVRVKLLMELLEHEKRAASGNRVLNEAVYEEDLLHIECPQTLSIVQDLKNKIDRVLIGVGKMYSERESQTEIKQYVNSGCQVTSQQQSVGCDGRLIIQYKACQTDSLIMANVDTQTNSGQNCGVQVEYEEVINAGTQTERVYKDTGGNLPYTPPSDQKSSDRNLSFATPTNREMSSFMSMPVSAKSTCMQTRCMSPSGISGTPHQSVSCRSVGADGGFENLQSSLPKTISNDVTGDHIYEPLSERELDELLVISRGHDARFFREMYLKICASTLHLNLSEQDPKIEIYMRRKLQKYFCGGDSYKQWVRVNSSLQNFRVTQGYTNRRIKNEKAEEAARLRKRFLASNSEESTAGTSADADAGEVHNSNEQPSTPVYPESHSKRRKTGYDCLKDSEGKGSERNMQRDSKESLADKSTTTKNFPTKSLQPRKELAITQNTPSKRAQSTSECTSVKKDRPANYKTTMKCPPTVNDELANNTYLAKQSQNHSAEKESPRVPQSNENNGSPICKTKQTITSDRNNYCNTSKTDVHNQLEDIINAVDVGTPTPDLSKNRGSIGKQNEIENIMPILIDSDSELISTDDDVIYERTVIRHIETSNTGLNQSVTCQQRSILRSSRCRISESSESSSDVQFADIKNSFANDIKEETLD